MSTKEVIDLLVFRNTAAIERELKLSEVSKVLESGDLHLIKTDRSHHDHSINDAGPIGSDIDMSKVVVY